MNHVSFTDSNGVRWSVKEDGADFPRAHSGPDGVPGTAWLRFESEYEVRRLWHYPDDWRGLNPLQLESLLDRASTVIARFRPASHRSPLLEPQRPAVADRETPDAESRRPASSPGRGPTRPPADDRSDDPDAP
jgi:hypothetical protein